MLRASRSPSPCQVRTCTTVSPSSRSSSASPQSGPAGDHGGAGPSTPRGQGVLLRRTPHLAARAWARRAHRAARHRVRRTPRSAPLKDRAVDRLALRLPPPDHPIRTKGLALPRLPRPGRCPDLLQEGRETRARSARRYWCCAGSENTAGGWTGRAAVPSREAGGDSTSGHALRRRHRGRGLRRPRNRRGDKRRAGDLAAACHRRLRGAPTSRRRHPAARRGSTRPASRCCTTARGRAAAVQQPPEAVARHRHSLREDRPHLPGRTPRRRHRPPVRPMIQRDR